MIKKQNPWKRLLKCLFGFHQMQECGCGIARMCIWCYKLEGVPHV